LRVKKSGLIGGYDEGEGVTGSKKGGSGTKEEGARIWGKRKASVSHKANINAAVKGAPLIYRGRKGSRKGRKVKGQRTKKRLPTLVWDIATFVGEDLLG